MASRPDRLAKGIILAAATALLVPGAAVADNLYCCTDGRSRKICSDRLPKQCIGKPHTIRDSNGRVTRVEGFVSASERRAREAEERKRREAEEAAAEKLRQDRALLATYGNVRDIDMAHQRAREAIEETIAEAERRMDVANKRRSKYASEAEFYKKETLPAEIKRGMRDTDNEIKAQTDLIELKRKELDGLGARFADERERYLNLTVRSRSDRLDR